MEDDYIFVEGSRYISAKRAAEITGYTSDYIGQIAREGKVRSKKIGRIRFVEEGELKEYTIESDRKKKAVQKLAKAVAPESPTAVKITSRPDIPEITPVTVNEDKPKVSEFYPDKKALDEEIPETKTLESTPDIEPVKLKIDATKDVSVRSKNDEWSFNGVAAKTGALSVALLIVFGPYVVSQTQVFSSVGDSMYTAYDNAIFNAEEVAVNVYHKVEEDGFTGMIFDSLAYSEMATRDALATSLEGYLRFGEFLRDVPESFDDSNESSLYGKMLGSVRVAFESIWNTLTGN